MGNTSKLFQKLLQKAIASRDVNAERVKELSEEIQKMKDQETINLRQELEHNKKALQRALILAETFVTRLEIKS